MEILPFLFFIGIFGFVIIVNAIAIDGHKERIGREIRHNGGNVIKVSGNLFSGNRSGNRYDVAFSDQFGNKHRTVCMTNGYDKELYWTKTPKELIGRARAAAAISRPTAQVYVEPSVLTSKEQIISDLHDENLRLKEELERLRPN